MFRNTLVAGALFCAALTGLPSAAFAADGQTLINQSKALNGNVTNGDAPGFPVTITRAGSFRLSGNLTVPANTNGIVIAANNVTLDLNGFTIAGGGSGAGVSNGGTGRLGTAIRNGTITNFLNGIDFKALGVAAQSTEVQQIRAIRNAGRGIFLNENSIVTGCTASGNAIGISAGTNSTLTGNNASDNSEAGLDVGARSLLSANTASGNLAGTGVGILISCPSNLVGNVAIDNSTDILELGGSCTRANNNPTP